MKDIVPALRPDALTLASAADGVHDALLILQAHWPILHYHLEVLRLIHTRPDGRIEPPHPGDEQSATFTLSKEGGYGVAFSPAFPVRFIDAVNAKLQELFTELYREG